MRRMQLLTSSISFLKRNKQYFFGALLVLTLFSLLTLFDAYYSVKNIEVSGARQGEVLGIYTPAGSNILLLDKKEYEEELLTHNPGIKSVYITTVLPDTVRVTVVKRTPAALFVADNGYFILDPDGKIVERTKTKKEELPVINYYQKLQFSSWPVGEVLNYKDILTALHFLGKAHDVGLTVDTIDISGLNMIALQINGKKLLFTTEKDTEVQGYQFDAIIRQLKVKGTDFAVLDFRFDKPVIQIK